MITIQINDSDKTPVYQQIYRFIKAEIESGNLKSGEKLPSKRALSQHLKVSVVTVETAYYQLLSEGYIRSKAGSGFYVEDNFFGTESVDIQEISEEEAEIKYDFSTNNMDTALFPFSVWAKLSRGVLNSKSTDLLNSCDFRGVESLREEIANYLKQFRGMNVSPERIVIGAGSEYLIGLLIQLLGRDMAYGVENPGYKKIYDIFSTNTSRVFPVPMDSNGANISSISGFGINVVHVTPSHHFPLGIVMPLKRKQELLQWAYAKEDRYILEDDYDSEICYDGHPMPTIQSLDRNGKVIYVNSFTRTLAPSIRIGYMVLPERLAERFCSRLNFYSCTVPVFEQFTLAEFMHSGQFERHVRRIRKVCKERRDVICYCVKNCVLAEFTEISGDSAGVHIVLDVKNGMSQEQLIHSAISEGVRVYSVSESYSFPVAEFQQSKVVLGFSAIGDDEIPKAVKALEKAWSK